jgi:hypothetical protein
LVIDIGVVTLQGSGKPGQISAAIVPRAASVGASPQTKIANSAHPLTGNSLGPLVRLALARITVSKFTQISAATLLDFDTGLVQ